ncbi:Heat shock 70 kDa protein 12A [Entomortierella chlamydospora]|uniref:Heat shock 70 kDa protein 12A n=1 Tax=Entomortierella chlamydospora TaxID=101097 RepID=A0A9P6MNY5_9FUNG|nr:Heat shock 70 kDa protein 12A [Entomortierella chlamydospora]KAG0008732.1 Heat shock 70 kDa protein 12A [Entomortierella chlamydospora]
MTHIDFPSGDFDPDDFPIVVAIDFGTTFSPKQNIQYAKTPTLNLYKEVNGKHTMMEWGWKSKLEMESPSASKHIQLAQYKPYLDENLVLTPWKNVVSVPDAISDYLYAFHEYAAEKILQEFGPSYSRKSFRYCLTVPAMWSDKAKDVMRRAAIRANVITKADHPERLMLVSEPEAAALYCERVCKQYELEHGDRFLICDAGGGTIDLIVYDIASSTQGRRLSEVTKGHGASCGSMFIDLNFRELLIRKFKSQGTKLPEGIILKLIETFAYQLKPHFDGAEDQYLALPLSDCFDHLKCPEAIGIDDGYMRLKASEMKEIVFEPVVTKVLALIREQLADAKECSAIFMVGGFGASDYLLDRVRQEFSDMVKIISAPYKPEVAVVCGAVYVGLSPKTVSTRVSRRCYGVSCEMEFQEDVDPIVLKRYRIQGVYCANRFSVFVTKGQKVQVNECVTRSYQVVKENSYDTGACSIRIYAVDGQPPRYTTGLHRLAEILIPGTFKSSDPLSHEVSVEMKMYFGLNEIKAEALIKGKKYSTTLRFEDGDSYTMPQERLL